MEDISAILDRSIAEYDARVVADTIVEAHRALKRAVRHAGDTRTRDTLAAIAEDARQVRINLGV